MSNMISIRELRVKTKCYLGTVVTKTNATLVVAPDS